MSGFQKFIFVVLIILLAGMRQISAQTLPLLRSPAPSSAAEVLYPQQELSAAPEEVVPYETSAIVDSLVTRYREVEDMGGVEAINKKIISDLARLPDDGDGNWHGHVNSVVFKDYNPNALVSLQQSDFAGLQSRLSNIATYVDEAEVGTGFFEDKIANTNLIEDMASQKESLGFSEALPDSVLFNLRRIFMGHILVPNSIIIPIWLKAAQEHFALAVSKNSQIEFERGMRLITTIEWQIRNKPEGHLLDVDDTQSDARNVGFAQFLEQTQPGAGVRDFADDAMGDIIRSQMESEFGKKIFRAYWEGQTDRYDLTPEEFSQILQAVAGLEYAEQDVDFADGSHGKRRDYSLADNFEYSKVLGSVSIYYDAHSQPVGFYDMFDFNWKLEGRSCKGEIQNRLVDVSGKTFGAEPFPILYGEIETNPDRAEPWYNRGPIPYITIPEDCMAEASEAVIQQLWLYPNQSLTQKLLKAAAQAAGVGVGTNW